MHVWKLLAFLNIHVCLVCLCRQIGDSYGVPKLHFKGMQEDFYVMVSSWPYVGHWSLLPCRSLRSDQCHQ